MTKTQAACLGLFQLLFVGCSSDTKIGTFNTAPLATITAPPDGSSVVAGADVILTGTVSDPDGPTEASS